MHRCDIVSIMMNTVESSDVPRGLLDWRSDHWVVVLTAYRTGSDKAVTVEMTLAQWFELPPVQYVVKIELSRQQPRRPTRVTCDDATTVPRGHIEWKNGQNWVILTAYCAGGDEVTTVEVTLTQWFALILVRCAVEERLERWQENRRWSQPK